MDEPLMTPKEVEELLNISPRQLRHLREKRAIPFIRIGTRPRFRREDVEKYIESQTIRARNL